MLSKLLAATAFIILLSALQTLFFGITTAATIAGPQLASSPGEVQSVITTYAGGGPLQLSGPLTITQIGIGSPDSVVADGSGGFYFRSAQRIYRVAPDGTLTHIAGNGTTGFSGDGGAATAAQLNYPSSIALDRDGNLFIADANNNRIRKVTSIGIITTVAGIGSSGFSGDDGPAVSAQVSHVNSIAVDRDNNIFVADSGNHRIRKISSSGLITTVAGNGTSGFSGDDGPATSARLSYSSTVAVDWSGNLFIADIGNHRIRKIDTSGLITTVAGNGTIGFSGDDGPATSAQLAYPISIAVDRENNLFIADSGNSRIRRVATTGIITTVAGNGSNGYSGDGGPAASAQLHYSNNCISVDGAGNLFVADSYNSRVRKVTSAGIINTVAGNGTFSGDGGRSAFSQLSYPSGVAIDGNNNLIIADRGKYRIAKVNTAQVITTLASAGLANPSSVASDADGNVFTTDLGNERIDRIDTAGKISSVGGDHDWYFFDYDGIVSPSGEVCIEGIAVDADGNLFVAQTFSQSIWKITPTGVVTRVAGAGNGTTGFSGDGGPATSARLSFPNGVAVDRDGNLFIADSYNNSIRKVTPDGIITTVAGNGTAGFSGDGGPATSAQLWYPLGVAVDRSGNLFIADSHNNRIRKVSPTGTITTVAGTGSAGFSGDDGPAESAQLNYPSSVAVDGDGNIFVADYFNNRIRKISFGFGLRVTGITPASGGQGKEILVTLTGLNFDSTLNIGSIDGITVSNLTVVSPTSATATFSVAAAAVPGPYHVPISISSGTSNAVTFTINPPPAVVSINPPVGVPGASVAVALAGRGFGGGLTIDAGSGITVSNIVVMNAAQATAIFSTDSSAAFGARDVTVTTPDGISAPAPFTVVAPFPDLAIASSHSATFGVGFHETYTIRVNNVGFVSTASAMTITDVLPTGLTFVSGDGAEWSCSSAGQIVTCSNSEPQGVGATTTLYLNVAVSSDAVPGVVHLVSVAVAGDMVPANNSATDVTTVAATPVPQFEIDQSMIRAGAQAVLGVTVSSTFPHDVTGEVTLGFSSNAAIPMDDPAIQFATGGRQIEFVIPANTYLARFVGRNFAGPVGFQTGTVAGTFRLSGTLQAGTVQTTFSPTTGANSRLTISRQAPFIQNVETSTQNGFAAKIHLLSTSREVTQLSLTFNTTPTATLNCGSVSGCSTSGSTMTFDVRSLFDDWFNGDSVFGSLSTLQLPLSISGSVHGSVSVRLRNSSGLSTPMSFPLP